MSTATEIRWLDRKSVLRVFRIPFRKLTELADEGFVRRLKFGVARQAAAVYCVADLESALEALSEGRTPRRPGRRRGRA